MSIKTAPRYLPMFNHGEYRVLDSKTNQCATEFGQGYQKTFAQHLSDCFNAGNKGVMQRFLIGDDSWLDALDLPKGSKRVSAMAPFGSYNIFGG